MINNYMLQNYKFDHILILMFNIKKIQSFFFFILKFNIIYIKPLALPM